MKVIWSFVVAVILIASLVVAAVSVQETVLVEEYFKNDLLSGTISVSLSDILFTAQVTSNKGDAITLQKFLDGNGADYDCSLLDCSNGYALSSSGTTSKSVSITPNEERYFGFVLYGNPVQVTGLDANFSSTFGKAITPPLELEFFEDTLWKFSTFSDTFSSQYWGCYNPTLGSPGPLIRTSSYCEPISLTETAAVKAGAVVNVQAGDTGELRMTLYPESGSGSIGTCVFDATTDDSCVIEADQGDTFAQGTYQVCVGADSSTDYELYDESSGAVCGFVYANGPENSVKDYGIFAQAAQYESAEFLLSQDMNLGELVSQADAIVDYRYNRDCTEGCVLPIKATGVAQSLQVKDVVLDAVINGEDRIEDKVYTFEVTPAKVNFSGVLDLSVMGFRVNQSGSYQLSLAGETLFSKQVRILPRPVVISVSPLAPPAGVPIVFTANIDYGGDRSGLTYHWDFGDGTKETTNENTATHTYPRISNFTLTLEVVAGDLSSKKSFKLDTISPQDAVDSALLEKQALLDEASDSMNAFPSWYRDRLRDFGKIGFYEGELDRLANERDNALSDAAYVLIAQELYGMDVPVGFTSQKELTIKLAHTLGDIDPSPVADFTGGVSQEFLSDYRQPILNWQGYWVSSSISRDVIALRRESGVTEEILSVYSMDIISRDESGNGYLVIERPKKDLFFQNFRDAQSSGDATIIVLEPNQRRALSFVYLDSEPATFFASPELSTLVIEAAIDTSCNYNLVCEEGLGEDWRTCRSDCRPNKRILIYSIILFFVALFAYTLLQLWYKYMYEGHLFGDRRQLRNLLMYISNARARGKLDGEIFNDLKQQGWPGEKVAYALRKSRGKSTGLPELIPFSKIGAKRRDKQAKERIATGSQQQNQRNINKSGFRGPYGYRSP